MFFLWINVYVEVSKSGIGVISPQFHQVAAQMTISLHN